MDGFARKMRTSRLIFIFSLILVIGLTTTFTINAQVSHSVTFWERGVGHDYTGVVVTIGGKGFYVTDVETCHTVTTESPVDFNYQSPLVVDSSKQYIWIYTTSDTNPPITTQQGTVPADMDGNVFGNYETQYSVTFSSNPAGIGTMTPSGSNVWISAGTIQISAAPSQGYSFSSWTTTGSITIANQGTESTSATISGPGTITANFQKQSNIPTYILYPFAIGHGSINPSIPVRVAQGTDKTFTFTPDDGYGVSAISVDGKPVSISSSYTFTNVRSNHNINVTFAVGVPKTVAITIDSSPSGQGFVSVDGNLTTTPRVFSWSPGSVHSLAASPLVNAGGDVRYTFSTWSDGGSQTHNYTVTSSPTSIIADYGTQYRLTINTNFGTVTPSSGSWYQNGSKVTVKAVAPSAVAGESYVFGGWKGSQGSYTGSSNPSGEFTMNGPVTEETTWQHIYQLNVSSSHGTTGGAGWYEVGQNVQASIDKTTETNGTEIQYVFSGWGGDASGTGSTSNTIVMDGPKSATAKWNTQYKLTFSQTGLEESAIWGVINGPMLTINGTVLAVGDLPYVTGWVNSGAVVQYTYSDSMTSSMGGVFKLGELSGPSSPLTVMGPAIISASYSFQSVALTLNNAIIIASVAAAAIILIVLIRARN